MNKKTIQKKEMLFRLILPVILLYPLSALAKIEPPPKTYLEDRVGIIKEQFKRQIITLLSELERKTGARVIVLIVDTTGGIPIEEYSLERAEKWKFGKNKKGASALIVIAVKDKKYRFEIGYELEGTLPDAYVGTLGRKYFVPYFRKGMYSEGIYLSILDIAQKIAKEKGVKLEVRSVKIPKSAMPREDKLNKLISTFIFLIFISLFILRLAIPRRRIWWLGGIYVGGGFGSNSGGFGGGFGSFGSGGGGGFGGGGASGSW